MRTGVGILSVFLFVSTLTSCRTTKTQVSAVKDDEVQTVEEGVVARSMFLPGQPLLRSVGELITTATSQVDIAIYMLDTDAESPLIQAISSPGVQRRLQSGDLRIRMIFQGSRGDADTQERSTLLEALGIDVRHMASSRKVHHKFALIDPGSGAGKMVTGTANWTRGTERSYTEAVLFLRNAPGLVGAYANEFRLLWEASEEFGAPGRPGDTSPVTYVQPEPGLNVFFNTENFAINGTDIRIDRNAPGYALTRRVVAAIDAATPEEPIRIAMTRISLKPIYDALRRAAGRGVSIKIALNQENYVPLGGRSEFVEPLGCDGEDAYRSECSTNKNYAYLLYAGDYPGANNVHVRIKYYNHEPTNFLGAQLHAKYFMVGDKELWLGSFNWSHSSEYYHFENLLQVDGEQYPQLMASFIAQHEEIFGLNRQRYSDFLQDFERNLRRGRRIWCQFRPMSLAYEEIDRLLATPARVEQDTGSPIETPDCSPPWTRD